MHGRNNVLYSFSRVIKHVYKVGLEFEVLSLVIDLFRGSKV